MEETCITIRKQIFLVVLLFQFIYSKNPEQKQNDSKEDCWDSEVEEEVESLSAIEGVENRERREPKRTV